MLANDTELLEWGRTLTTRRRVALIPRLVLLVLSYLVFKPRVPKLLAFWISGFAGYMAIHVLLVIFFDLGFLFAVWTPG